MVTLNKMGNSPALPWDFQGLTIRGKQNFTGENFWAKG
jgi:hypothetical protein